jgi:tetratricopeptide (TPR) repeat protein
VQGLLDLRQADKYAELAKDDAFRKFIHAECFWMRDNNVRAKEEITKAIELNPNRPRFYHFRGFIEKDFDAEMKDYEEILKHHPTYPRMSTIYNNMGFAKSKIQLYEEGMELYLKAIEICPHHVRPYYNLAVIHAERRNHEEAVAVVNKILTINPNLTEVAALRGWVYHNNAQLKEALDDYITSLQKDQDDVETILNLHSITIFTGKLDDMIEVNRKFLDKLIGDLKGLEKKRENIKKALETTFKTMNEGLIVENWNYIDPFIDVNKKETELKRALRKIYRNLAECHMQYGIVEISRDEFQEMLKYPTTDEKSTEKDQDSKFLSFLYDTSGMKIEDISDEARELTKTLIGTISTPVLVARRRQIAEGRLRTVADVQLLFVNYCFKKMNLYFPGDNHETRLTTLGKLLTEVTNYFNLEHMSLKHKAMALFCSAPHFLFHLIELSWRAQGPTEVPNTLEMQVTACYQQNEDPEEFLEKMAAMLNFHKPT